MSFEKAFLDIVVDGISVSSIVVGSDDANVVDVGSRGVGIEVDGFSATYVDMKSSVTITLPLEWETVEW